MTEPPYPGPGGPAEPVVTYSLRDVIDQINTKLDLLTTTFGSRMSDVELRLTTMETRPAPIRDGELRMATVETRTEKLGTRMDAQESLAAQAYGASAFKDRAFAKMVGLATVMGVVAGATVGVIGLLT